MENTFEALKQVYDYIIVDTPPVSVVTDAAVLCKYADGALLVVRPGVTTIEGAQLSKKNLEAVNARILGVVMNGYNVKKPVRKMATTILILTGTAMTTQLERRAGVRHNEFATG